MDLIVDLVGGHTVTPHLSATYPLDRAREALAAVETGHATGKVVIVN